MYRFLLGFGYTVFIINVISSGCDIMEIQTVYDRMPYVLGIIFVGYVGTYVDNHKIT